jgi:hypothetical protein
MKWVNLGIVVVALASASVGTAAEAGRSKASKYTKKKNDPEETQRRDLLRIKRVFMFAVDDCANNQRCDKQLMHDSESSFMDACKACADTEKCEADRDTIKNGDGKLSFNPCAETTAASTTKK